MNFAVPADHSAKIKESEKLNKYLDFVRKQKMLRNMKVMEISNTVGALGTVPKGLEKRYWELGIRRRMKTIPITALLKSGFLKESWRSEKTSFFIRLQWKTICESWCEKLTKSKIIMNSKCRSTIPSSWNSLDPLTLFCLCSSYYCSMFRPVHSSAFIKCVICTTVKWLLLWSLSSEHRAKTTWKFFFPFFFSTKLFPIFFTELHNF